MQKLFLYIICVLALASCTEKVKVDLSEFENRVVIEGQVSNEIDSSRVKLSFTKGYFDQGDFKKITNATVEITKNDHDSTFAFIHVKDGEYKAPAGFRGVPGNTYNLRVVVDGKEYKSSSYLRPMFIVLDSISEVVYPPTGGPFSNPGIALSYYGCENRTDVAYTRFVYYTNGEEGFNAFFDNKLSDKGDTAPFELPFARFETGDTVDLIFYSLDERAYNYLVALENLDSGIPGPFQSPPANPPTNIRNGGLGYFSAFDIVRRRKIVQ